MTTLLFFLNLACVGSSAFLMWICYKREQKNYLSIATMVAIFYQILYVDLGKSYSSFILSVVYMVIIWVIIKAYSNKINAEHNANLLKAIQDECQKFEAQSKEKK